MEDTAPRPMWKGIGQWHAFAVSIEEDEPELDDAGE